jgi:sugar phosphate isomerase/epimerase
VLHHNLLSFDIEFFWRNPSDTIDLFHFNDAPDKLVRAEQTEQTDADRVYPGDGILDLKRMISILQDADYSGVISLELFNPSYWEQDPAEVARIGLEKMQAVLDN